MSVQRFVPGTLAERRISSAQVRYPLEGCPWCGEQPEVQRWHGGGPRKRLVGCVNDDCPAAPSVTGPTLRKACANWNQRVGTAVRS